MLLDDKYLILDILISFIYLSIILTNVYILIWQTHRIVTDIPGTTDASFGTYEDLLINV